MSKITSIAANNVKGLEIDEKLTGREIYVGPNGWANQHAWSP